MTNDQCARIMLYAIQEMVKDRTLSIIDVSPGAIEAACDHYAHANYGFELPPIGRDKYDVTETQSSITITEKEPR